MTLPVLLLLLLQLLLLRCCVPRLHVTRQAMERASEKYLTDAGGS